MVARINFRRSVNKALNYNEAKVRAGTGTLLLAAGFGCDIGQLTFSDKLHRFECLNQRRESVKVNTLHISLNFSPGENLTPDMMQLIALDYMERIGFGQQPFLVYEHKDAQHPHLHIVTSTVQADGEPIQLHNIGKDLSEPAREAIEQEYGLICARGRNSRQQDPGAEPDLARTVQEVTTSYAYTSLEELNAVLAPFHMTAWRGAPGSGIRRNKGLVYSRTDAAGNRIGTPIKSSDLTTRPTLAWLTRRFEANKIKKLSCSDQTVRAIAKALNGNPTPQQVVQRLQRFRIRAVSRRPNAQDVLGIAFVDEHNKIVLTPEDAGIPTERLALLTPALAVAAAQPTIPSRQQEGPLSQQARPRQDAAAAVLALQTLLNSPTGSPGLAGDEPTKKKKRKKRIL